jgi:hypothetical protein
VCYGLSVAPQNRREDEDGAGHVSGSSGLLHLEASRARVSEKSSSQFLGLIVMSQRLGEV